MRLARAIIPVYPNARFNDFARRNSVQKLVNCRQKVGRKDVFVNLLLNRFEVVIVHHNGRIDVAGDVSFKNVFNGVHRK
jgi:hypothetical protein